MKALLIGGTAASGPHIVNELQRRNYEVTIYHRGAHEVPLPTDVRHIHGEPHFVETIEADLRSTSWDLVVATYGRLRYLADYLRGKTPRLITVGGFPVMKGWMHITDQHWAEHAGPVPIPSPEDTPYEDQGVDHFVDRMIDTEKTIIGNHKAGYYSATHFRYCTVYGPYGVGEGFAWPIIKRILDGRRRFVIQDAGQYIMTRCAAPNAAHSLALAIDNPGPSGGQIYHVGDDQQYTIRGWAELVAQCMDAGLEFVDIPTSVLPPGDSIVQAMGTGSWSNHRIMDIAKIKSQLGYRDVVSAADWVKATVRWVLENRPDQQESWEPGERFNYAAENVLMDAWTRFIRSTPKLGGTKAEFRHPYAHPKKLGDPE